MQSKIKDELEKLVKEKGYASLNAFCVENGLNTANVYTNLRSTWGLSIKRAFAIANGLGVPVEQILEMFYKEQFKENRKYIKKRSKTSR